MRGESYCVEALWAGTHLGYSEAVAPGRRCLNSDRRLHLALAISPCESCHAF